jgi:hypothetical protein
MRGSGLAREVRGSTSRPSPQSPKGILGSPPPRARRMHAVDHPNLLIFNPLNRSWLVKTPYPGGKIYAELYPRDDGNKVPSV